jgi:hypothetical protein
MPPRSLHSSLRSQRWRHWSFEGLSLRGDLKPAVIWLAMKRGVMKVSTHLAPEDLFGLQMRLEVPQGTSLNLAGKVKPLFDGIISAFQACASPPPRVVLQTSERGCSWTPRRYAPC